MSGSKPLSLEEFHATREYLCLTAKQKKFVDAYIVKHDPKLAAAEAYDTDNATILSHQVMGSAKILKALAVCFGREVTEEFPNLSRSKKVFLKQLKAVIQKGDVSPATLSLMRLYAELNGWTTPVAKKLQYDVTPEPPEQSDPEPRETLLDDFPDPS